MAEPDTPERVLARYIIRFLRRRNGGELRDVFDDMRVRDARLLLGELERILIHGGRPPNWVPEADDEDDDD